MRSAQKHGRGLRHSPAADCSNIAQGCWFISSGARRSLPRLQCPRLPMSRGPSQNQRKSDGAGLIAPRPRWHRLPACAPAPVKYRYRKKLFGPVPHGPLAHPQSMKSRCRGGSRTAPTGTFQDSCAWAVGPPINDEKWLAVDHGARCAP
jgi:hypothetical protein